MKKIIYICMTTTAILLASCQKLVTVNPQNQLAPAQLLTDANGYLTVLAGVYAGVEGYGYWGRDMVLLGDALADNIVTDNGQAAGRYTNVNLNVQGNSFTIWTNAYFYINQLNIIIAGINTLNVPAGQKALQAQIYAQAFAMRGLIYFDLARVYGWEPNNVPTSGPDASFQFSAVLRLTPTVGALPKQARSTIAQTYAQIESDLLKAITLFKAIGTSKPSVPFAFSESAAHGILAKVYLYAQDYTNCVTQCQAALDPTICPGILTPAGTYSKAFKSPALTPNPESLLELNYNQGIQVTGVTGSNNAPYTYTQPTGYGFAGVGLPGVPNGISTFGGQTVSDELLAAFDTPTDDRLAMFYKSRTASTATVFTWCNKYSGAAGLYTDNIPVLRYSDVLLMEAEAMAAQGQFAAAQALVIKLRAARNASVASVPADATLNAFIQNERRRELFFEGNRFFDLKRLAAGVPKAAKTAVGTIAANDFRIIAPLPTTEVLFNPALPQNPNY
jgi:hypothetical protein